MLSIPGLTGWQGTSSLIIGIGKHSRWPDLVPMACFSMLYGSGPLPTSKLLGVRQGRESIV